MKKKITLFIMCACGLLSLNAQNFAFTNGDDVIANDATVEINPVESIMGFMAETNNSKYDYALKNLSNETISFSFTLDVVSRDATITSPVLLCIAGNCVPCQTTVTKNFTIAAGAKENLMTELDFTNDDMTAAVEGKCVAKLTAKGGTETRTLNISFENKGGGVEGVLANSDIKVVGNEIQYNFANAGNYSLNIYSISGQQIQKTNLDQSGSISLSELGNGYYVYSITEGLSNIKTGKVLVK